MQLEPEHSQMKVAAVVCFYIVAALVMVFVNKAVLNRTPDLPFTFLFIQLAIAVVLIRALAVLGRTPIRRLLPISFEVPALDRNTALKMLPFFLVGFIGLVFNTLCLANVDASFFQIARGLLLPFTILMSSLFTRVVPRLSVIISALIVTSGFFCRLANADSTPLLALLYGLISCIVLSLHAVLSKVVTSSLTHVSVVALCYWGNLGMSIFLIPFVFFNGELVVLQRRWASPEDEWTTFVVGSAITGIFGFLLGIANVLSIKVTSPISHMFSAAAKSVIQMLLGVIFFGDIVTGLRVGAITLITGGTMFYTWSQGHMSQQKIAPKPLDVNLEEQSTPFLAQEEREEQNEKSEDVEGWKESTAA
ncbi:hypothetical protein C8F04DRAFT_966812 [Mycena alexandri]|uniref:Sugar phosphate transporter domain-containing protein n=1 Tax=Mycena alexandri TaxID=1745969 RepID=A0AAD6WUW7_9AGAR|nr:hypothetical protein C8F04DRAFT_966812 [Mycena alexandri]